MKNLVKGMVRTLGYTITKRDRLAEQIPTTYNLSPILPRLSKNGLNRALYLAECVKRIQGIGGDIVECGVSVGHGLLTLALLSERAGENRRVWGFDSFQGFPPIRKEDLMSDGSSSGTLDAYATPPELVMAVLRDGGVRHIDRVRLVPGFFSDSLRQYEGSIALLNLDCDLYESYQQCLSALYHRVVPGWIVMFDEYYSKEYPGAKQAIDEFLGSGAAIQHGFGASGYLIKPM
jgi:hypothetical protein